MAASYTVADPCDLALSSVEVVHCPCPIVAANNVTKTRHNSLHTLCHDRKCLVGPLFSAFRVQTRTEGTSLPT